MNQTLKAILARFGFNKTAALRYCEDMQQYPQLRAEYRALMESLLDQSTGG